MDEIHTPDSSRYYILEGYEENLIKGVKQKQLSKEFVREWLMENEFQGQEGQVMPNMPDSFVQEISNRYIELYEKITGSAFKKPKDQYEIAERIERNVLSYLDQKL
jgi:phosphoribosylaminoimidazole-succinocarboxamide synthase